MSHTLGHLSTVSSLRCFSSSSSESSSTTVHCGSGPCQNGVQMTHPWQLSKAGTKEKLLFDKINKSATIMNFQTLAKFISSSTKKFMFRNTSINLNASFVKKWWCQCPFQCHLAMDHSTSAIVNNVDLTNTNLSLSHTDQHLGIKYVLPHNIHHHLCGWDIWFWNEWTATRLPSSTLSYCWSGSPLVLTSFENGCRSHFLVMGMQMVRLYQVPSFSQFASVA